MCHRHEEVFYFGDDSSRVSEGGFPPLFAPACYSVQMRDVIGCGRCVSQPPLMVASLAPEEA